jgi:FkbM family methyltransferase
MNKIKIYDENNNEIDIDKIEYVEQSLVKKYILPSDTVLELGARYGSVSCTINQILNNKSNQVSVEPDKRVWNALEQNKMLNNCDFNIIHGFISNKKLNLTNLDVCRNGYGSTYMFDEYTPIPSYCFYGIKKELGLRFNVLIADCEGGLGLFLDEYDDIYDDLRLIIFEADYKEKCNYEIIKETLKDKGFVNILDGFQNVWAKDV